MKKALIGIFTVALVASAAFAALDAYDTMTVKTISALKLASGIQTNAAVDVSGAKGVCNLLVEIGPAYTNAATFGASATLKHCASSGGTYVTVTNGAGSAVVVTGAGITGTGAVTSVKVESEKLLRYVKLFTTVTNDACDIGAVLIYPK